MGNGKLFDKFFSTFAGIIFAVVVFLFAIGMIIILNKIITQDNLKPDTNFQTKINPK